jgi:histone H3/H4
MSEENLVIVSKVKKFIKDNQGLNTSQTFFAPLNKDIIDECNKAVESAKQNGRKTVMGRDFAFFEESAEIGEVLIVASKVKKMIKEQSGLNTSQQVVEQLTARVQDLCLKAIKSAVEDKRKTVLDRDYAPTTYLNVV